MIDQELEEFVSLLESYLSKLDRPLHGLEMFSREGSWVTHKYTNLVNEMECWEINQKYISALSDNLPIAKVKQVDSIEYARRCADRFNFISLDNPQGTFGDYCEHFEALPAALKILSEKSVITFPVNIMPYLKKSKKPIDDYGMASHSVWFERRDEFYGLDAGKLDLGFVSEFYVKYFSKHSFHVRFSSTTLFKSVVENHPDYFVRYAALISKTSEDI